MNDLSQTLKKGTLLLIERGEYSDRDWSGPVRMLVDATKQELVDEFIAGFEPDPEWQDDPPDPSQFLPWLISSGRAEHVDCESWHVGSYGQFEP